MRHWSAGDHRWTLQTIKVDFDAAANQTTRWLRYDKWRDGNLVASELQSFRLQHWSIREFDGLLAAAGFTERTVTGDYTRRTPDADTGVWTFQAFRP